MSTVTEGFMEEPFLRLHLLSKSPEEVRAEVLAQAREAQAFLCALAARL
ncbi:hypothetical protein [Vannielia litorea]|nr:hypothetical protein [Vannielia litorea]